jgi:hypothetical protein
VEGVAEPYRVNTKSLDVALRTAKLLTQKTKVRYTIGVSTRSMLMLDFDISRRRLRFSKRRVDLVVVFARAFADMLGCDATLYLTPRGFHAVFWKRLTEEEWRNLLVSIIEVTSKDERLRSVLDVKHLEAALRRGYVTLRLNQLCRYADVVRGEVKVYPECEGMISYEQ